MIRFVVIGSLKRGAVEPGEVLDEGNQRIAIARFEAEESLMGERVYWRDGQAYVDVLAGSGEKRPKISEELRRSLVDGQIINEHREISERWRREARRLG